MTWKLTKDELPDVDEFVPFKVLSRQGKVSDEVHFGYLEKDGDWYDTSNSNMDGESLNMGDAVAWFDLPEFKTT